MKLKGAKIVPGVAFLVLSFLIPNLSRAQAGAVLSGAITDSAGRVVPNAKISVKNPTIYADLEVQFAGQTAQYRHLAFQRVTRGNQVQISGTIPATCSDFKIDRPSFLTVPIKNEIPVRIEMTWHPM